jgi:hypothetical protein
MLTDGQSSTAHLCLLEPEIRSNQQQAEPKKTEEIADLIGRNLSARGMGANAIVMASSVEE